MAVQAPETSYILGQPDSSRYYLDPLTASRINFFYILTSRCSRTGGTIHIKTARPTNLHTLCQSGTMLGCSEHDVFDAAALYNGHFSGFQSRSSLTQPFRDVGTSP